MLLCHLPCSETMQPTGFVPAVYNKLDAGIQLRQVSTPRPCSDLLVLERHPQSPLLSRPPFLAALAALGSSLPSPHVELQKVSVLVVLVELHV